MQPRETAKQFLSIEDGGGVRATMLRRGKEVLVSALYGSGDEIDIFLDPETYDIFCPTCGNEFLVVGGTAGPNEEQTMRCPGEICQMVWRKSNDLPPGIGLVE